MGDKPEARRRLGLADHKRVILFFGYWRRNKGPIDLLDAFLNLPENNAVLVFAGAAGKIGSLIKDRVSTRADILTIGEEINDNDVQLYMNAADVVALPYHASVATSGVLLLAMSFGRPHSCSFNSGPTTITERPE